MGNSYSTYIIVHAIPMPWKNSRPWLTRWSDKHDDSIEQLRARDGIWTGHPLFKLQINRLSSSARIVVHNAVSSTQVTIIQADSEHNARLGYQHLVHMVLSEDDVANPETVRLALESRQIMHPSRLQSLVNSLINRFPEPLLQPFDRRWNPAEFEADIILVHGLGGDSQATWTNAAGLWPVIWLLDSHIGIRSMLGQYNISDLPPENKIRVLTVSHNAAMFNTNAESNPIYIADRLAGLLLHAGVGSKPVIWLAHSLGGLIVKEVLFASQDGNERIF
ncbi:unnamed protein product [Rotaria magnacalcarata]|uniref:Uncharacterized protein n=1 Tax=Rotaria magnacalcarata TaxID=392030 RepID=A0A816GR98_9BILA|nr:unnamed protein product [Rotaria magnacalcarata]CAF1676889.1 unnamed protein product [Rotaria magnacalcarata]CAF2041392.1 unnamed protein product [Rotaria magnacalcarata]CAF4440604.1 unnamed protein product [Rotaria magnacalcarata]CAF4980997.1 unnamed protein product [Rotaria magnacalcarata]